MVENITFGTVHNDIKAALEGKNVLDKDYLYFNMNITSTKNRCKNAGKSWQIIDSHNGS